MTSLVDTKYAVIPSDTLSANFLGFGSTPVPAAFDSLTRLAVRLLDVPVALISIVDDAVDRQFFAAQVGLNEPWASEGGTPLSHSFCQHVKHTNQSFVVNDARNNSLVCDNLAIRDLDVGAYLGVPIHDPDGTALGALCVISSSPRAWTNEDQTTLEDLAVCVTDEILLRALVLKNSESHARTTRYNALRESITMAFMAPDLHVDQRFTELLRAGCGALGIDHGLIAQIDCDTAQILFRHGPTPAMSPCKPQDFAKTVTARVVQGQQQICFDGHGDREPDRRRSLTFDEAGCYAGTPLILDGVLFGVLEFWSTTPRAKPWTDEELSMLSIISMFACAHLALFGQIKSFTNAETSLLKHLADTRLTLQEDSGLSLRQ